MYPQPSGGKICGSAIVVGGHSASRQCGVSVSRTKRFARLRAPPADRVPFSTYRFVEYLFKLSFVHSFAWNMLR